MRVNSYWEEKQKYKFKGKNNIKLLAVKKSLFLVFLFFYLLF